MSISDESFQKAILALGIAPVIREVGMQLHYMNSFRENVDEEIDDLAVYGFIARMGEPAPTATMDADKIKGFGVFGIYIDVADDETRTGVEVVNDAKHQYFEDNPED